MPQYDVDLRDYWRIIKRRKIVIALMVLLVGVCSYGFAKLKEPTPMFRASTTIKIEQTTNMVSFFTGGWWRQQESMMTHAQIIASFPVLVETAKIIGWIPENAKREQIQQSKPYLTAIQRLKSLVTAEYQENTNLIDVVVESKDPNEAALVANAVAEAYRVYNIQEKNRKTFETKEFIEEQLRKTEVKLKQAEADLQRFQEGYTLVSMDRQTGNILSRLHATETEYENTVRQRSEYEGFLSSLGKTQIMDPDTLQRALLFPDRDSQLYHLTNRLRELVLQRGTLLIDYTEQHPLVKEVSGKIRIVKQEIHNHLASLVKALRAREADLKERVSVLRQENQKLPEKALQLVRLQREVDLQVQLHSQLKAKYQETLIQESGKVEEVILVKPALVPAAPFNIPSKMIIVLTGIVMGLIIGIVFGFLFEVFDTSMGTIEDVEELLEVPVVGLIPYLDRDEKDKRTSEEKTTRENRIHDIVTHYDPKSLASEAFRSLRTNLQFIRLEKNSKLFLVTSSFVQEGKTLNVVNLALSLAQIGERVLLVEADLRKPTINKILGLSREPGLTDFVLGNYTWEETVNNITDVMLGDFEIDDILRTPGLDNLHVIMAGTRPPNPSEIISSQRFKTFLKEAADEYDYVFVDAPPVLPVADASEIAPQVDGVLLVYTVGKIGRGVLKRAKTTLDNLDAKVLGVILNNVKPEIGPDYFKYHTQYYYGVSEDQQKKA